MKYGNDDGSFFAPHELDETTLMNIFARKVNVMFGMGGDGGEEGG